MTAQRDRAVTDCARRALAALGVGVLVAGCGGSNPGVARIGGTKLSTGGTGAHEPARRTGALYASCMRAHGVPNFPDSAVSVIGGQVEIHVPRAVKREPNIPSASRTCQKDLPGSVAPAKHVNMREELSFARCMRSRGISDFPDPLPGGGWDLPGNTNTPQFEAAAQACQTTGIHWNGP